MRKSRAPAFGQVSLDLSGPALAAASALSAGHASGRSSPGAASEGDGKEEEEPGLIRLGLPETSILHIRAELPARHVARVSVEVPKAAPTDVSSARLERPAAAQKPKHLEQHVWLNLAPLSVADFIDRPQQRKTAQPTAGANLHQQQLLLPPPQQPRQQPLREQEQRRRRAELHAPADTQRELRASRDTPAPEQSEPVPVRTTGVFTTVWHNTAATLLEDDFGSHTSTVVSGATPGKIVGCEGAAAEAEQGLQRAPEALQAAAAADRRRAIADARSTVRADGSRPPTHRTAARVAQVAGSDGSSAKHFLVELGQPPPLWSGSRDDGGGVEPSAVAGVEQSGGGGGGGAGPSSISTMAAPDSPDE